MNQPDYDTPLSIGLTPQEILALANRFASGSATYQSHIDGLGDIIQSNLACENPRTAFSCRMVGLAYPEDGCDGTEADMLGYAVELYVDDIFISSQWEAKVGADSDEVLMTQAAHKTFITWSALIGVPVGYALVVRPDAYLAQVP